MIEKKKKKTSLTVSCNSFPVLERRKSLLQNQVAVIPLCASSKENSQTKTSTLWEPELYYVCICIYNNTQRIHINNELWSVPQGESSRLFGTALTLALRAEGRQGAEPAPGRESRRGRGSRKST